MISVDLMYLRCKDKADGTAEHWVRRKETRRVPEQALRPNIHSTDQQTSLPDQVNTMTRQDCGF